METVKDYFQYNKKVFEDFLRVKRFFPLLTISVLPTLKPSEIIISGYILPPKMSNILTPTVINNYGFKIKGVYPFDFPKVSIEVYDVENKIKWEEIPENHRHYFPGDGGRLCTHHPLAEINSIPELDRTIAILMSAWQLYYQVKLYTEEGKNWIIKDLPHGEKVYTILRREGWIK